MNKNEKILVVVVITACIVMLTVVAISYTMYTVTEQRNSDMSKENVDYFSLLSHNENPIKICEKIGLYSVDLYAQHARLITTETSREKLKEFRHSFETENNFYREVAQNKCTALKEENLTSSFKQEYHEMSSKNLVKYSLNKENDPDWECKKWIGIVELAKQDYPGFVEDTLEMAEKKCGFDVDEFTN